MDVFKSLMVTVELLSILSALAVIFRILEEGFGALMQPRVYLIRIHLSLTNELTQLEQLERIGQMDEWLAPEWLTLLLGWFGRAQWLEQWWQCDDDVCDVSSCLLFLEVGKIPGLVGIRSFHSDNDSGQSFVEHEEERGSYRNDGVVDESDEDVDVGFRSDEDVDVHLQNDGVLHFVGQRMAYLGVLHGWVEH